MLCQTTRTLRQPVCSGMRSNPFEERMLHPLAAEFLARVDLEPNEIQFVVRNWIRPMSLNGHCLALIDEHQALNKCCDIPFALWVEDLRHHFRRGSKKLLTETKSKS
jgi:hypothetical protein